MEINRSCKICGITKPIFEFGKKSKSRYRTECKICYNKIRRDFKKLSEAEKIKIKTESKLKEEEKKIQRKKIKEEKEIEKEIKKRLKYENLLQEYEERMKLNIEKRNDKIKNYLCKSCGDYNPDNFYNKRKTKCKACLLLTSKQYYRYDKMTEDEKKVYIEKRKNRYDKMTEDEKKVYIEKQKIWTSNNIIKVRVLAAKHRAIRKNIPFEINEDIVLDKLKEQDGKCYISKQQLTFNENEWYGLSLDRLDSNLGYTVENTILVTKFVNISKNNLTYSDYIKFLKEVCNNL